jgi:hypothetical protein
MDLVDGVQFYWVQDGYFFTLLLNGGIVERISNDPDALQGGLFELRKMDLNAPVNNANANTITEDDKTYYFTLESSDGGTIPASGADRISGDYAVGSVIHLSVRSVPGYVSDKWVASNEKGLFDDEYKLLAVFTMPDCDITVTALFKPLNDTITPSIPALYVSSMPEPTPEVTPETTQEATAEPTPEPTPEITLEKEATYYFTLTSSDGGTIHASGANLISGDEYAVESEIIITLRGRFCV